MMSFIFRLYQHNNLTQDLSLTLITVPCAMLINLAFVMDKYFKQIRSNNDISIKLVFFDGEEAFLYWNPQDSIYGARHLAQKWENEGFLPKIVSLCQVDFVSTRIDYNVCI